MGPCLFRIKNCRFVTMCIILYCNVSFSFSRMFRRLKRKQKIDCLGNFTTQNFDQIFKNNNHSIYIYYLPIINNYIIIKTTVVYYFIFSCEKLANSIGRVCIIGRLRFSRQTSATYVTSVCADESRS